MFYKETEVYRLVCCAVLVLNFVGDASSNQSPSVLVPALRTVGNIVTGNDMQTQVSGHPGCWWYWCMTLTCIPGHVVVCSTGSMPSMEGQPPHPLKSIYSMSHLVAFGDTYSDPEV
jgi:hypothetical protein